MLVHAYVFLSTIFIGLQGAAFYRHHLNKTTSLQYKEIVENNNQKTITTIDAVSEQLAHETVIESQDENLPALRSPEEMQIDINKEVGAYFEMNSEPEEIAEEELATNTEEAGEIIAMSDATQEAVAEDETSDIIVFDYAKAEKSTPKIAMNAAVKSKRSEIDEFLEIHQPKKKVDPQTPMYFQGEYKFSLDDRIDSKKIELRSLISNEEVYFNDKNVGSIVKNFTSNESTEIYQAVYPMAMAVNVKAYWQQGREFTNYVPLISQSYIDQLYKEMGISGEWGMALVALNEEISYFELENYKAVVFLDADLNEIEESAASYALYLGIAAGNHDFKFIAHNTNINYPVYITENVISFIDPVLDEKNMNKNFSLYENLPLSKEYRDIYITSEQIAPITSNAYIEKNGLNNYTLDSRLRILSNKEMLLVQVEGQNFYINADEAGDKIIIPSTEYINQIIETIPHADAKCIVQIKPKKEVDYIENRVFAQNIDSIQGKNTYFTSEEVATERFLDSDGIFYPTESKKTKKAFFITEDEGLLLVKIVYKDGSVESKEYFCENKDYHLDSGEE